MTNKSLGQIVPLSCSSVIHIQVRSFSEAMAETVGSLMVSSSAKNRYLEPINFEKEMVMMFNLPSLHILLEAFILELVEELLEENKKKRMFRKYEKERPLWCMRLVSEELSAALFYYRKKEEEKLKRVSKHCDFSMYLSIT